jgi:uncharacterized membrane protein YhaH (DUF805 family)
LFILCSNNSQKIAKIFKAQKTIYLTNKTALKKPFYIFVEYLLVLLYNQLGRETMNYIKNYLKNYANFKGLTTRKEYAITIIFFLAPLVLVGFQILATVAMFYSRTQMIPTKIFVTASIAPSIYILANIVPLLSMTWRRLHDAGYTGVFALNLFVPLGIIVLIGFICLPSQFESNPYRIMWEKQQAQKTQLETDNK